MKNKTDIEKKILEIQPIDSIERWTIDRLDRDAGVARLEKVPLAKEFSDEFVSMIAAKADITTERLEWWDSSQTTVEYISIAELKDFLTLETDVTLNENMVFWILKIGSELTIIHATNQARSLAGELYRKVMGLESGGTKNDKK